MGQLHSLNDVHMWQEVADMSSLMSVQTRQVQPSGSGTLLLLLLVLGGLWDNEGVFVFEFVFVLVFAAEEFSEFSVSFVSFLPKLP